MRRFGLTENSKSPTAIIHQEDPFGNLSFEDLVEELETWSSSFGSEHPRPKKEGFDLIRRITTEKKLKNISWMLPLFFQLRHEPVTLTQHKYMEVLFNTDIPTKTLLKAGRQVGKTQTLAFNIVLQGMTIPDFNTLYVAPLKDQTQKFSRNYLSPILTSMIFTDKKVLAQTRNIMQKDLPNGSKVFFHYAYTSAERIRGVAVDKIAVDEVSLIDPDLIKPIYEVMSHSIWFLQYYAGTPKTTDNYVENLWGQSSQAEWRMKCPHCGRYNYPTLEDGVMDMIQDKGFCCLKCGKLLDPGNTDLCAWEHRVGHRRKLFAGFHIPQTIVPVHLSNPAKWRELVTKKNTWPTAVFANEILGESYDIGAKPITREDLKTASILWPNDLSTARKKTKRYLRVIAAVDWGGGGEDEISTTAVSIMGITPRKRIETLYMTRLARGLSADQEVQRVISLHRGFQCSKLAHDAAGAGARDILLVQAGMPKLDIIPFWYVGGMHTTISRHRASAKNPRTYYTLHKSVCIRIVCAAIAKRLIRFPSFETTWRFTQDFMQISEEKHDVGMNQVYLILHSTRKPDDFVDATTYGAMALWFMTKSFPELAKAYGLSYSSSDAAGIGST